MPVLNYGFSKGTGPMLKTKQNKKKLVEIEFTIYLEGRREQRETTDIY